MEADSVSETRLKYSVGFVHKGFKAHKQFRWQMLSVNKETFVGRKFVNCRFFTEEQGVRL